MALSKHFEPVEHFGFKFDRGMILYEFDAFREPEKTRFPQIGDWLGRENFNEIPTPKMLWRGKLWPDLYIANQLDALKALDLYVPRFDLRPRKEEWGVGTQLNTESAFFNGIEFHETFIEPMCRKITGRSSAEICAKHHRSVWLPLYWPETLRKKQSLRTPFYYPRDGFAGALARDCGDKARNAPDAVAAVYEGCEISIAFIIAKPRDDFSVLFVVDESPIYRVTDMDVCAGIETEFHRWVVEFRGTCGVMYELQRLGLALTFHACAFGSVKLSLPTIENVKNGWKPKPHMNDMLWEAMNCSLTT